MAAPVLVATVFLVAVAGALAAVCYVAYWGSRASPFFREVVKDTYDLSIATVEIDNYYALKDRLYDQYVPDEADDLADDPTQAPVWTQRIPPEALVLLQKNLMNRMVACIEKLNQVQHDKPGNQRLYHAKLVTETFWNSLCDAERLVSDELDSCIAEADELRPGWRHTVVRDAVSFWRMQKQHEAEKKAEKKAVVDEKKSKKGEERKKEVELRKVVEDKVREEKAAEKAAAQMMREEELAAKVKAKGRAGERAPAPKSKGKKSK